MGFPITIICTLQGTSVTQGNPAIFTGNKFAVHVCTNLVCNVIEAVPVSMML